MAKIVAWVLCITSVMGTIVLGFCVMVGIGENWFGQTREEALKKAYESANAVYSMQAFRELDDGSMAFAKELRNEYFRYGIIKSDNLKGIDFHDRLSYLDTNMTVQEIEEINPDQLFVYQVVRNDAYPLSGRRRGYYGDYEDISALDAAGNNLRNEYSTKWTYLYADRICYDVARGIVYYRADGNYYPVQNVSLCYDGSEGQTVYHYNYDFTNKGYKLSYKSPGDKTAWADEDILNSAGELRQEADTTQSDQTEAIEEILDGKDSGSIINLAALNDTAFSYMNWGTILLDNIRYIRGDELTPIHSGSIADSFFVGNPGYYLNEDYTLVVQEDIQTDNYWIVSIIPDYVPADRMDSQYNHEGWFVNFYYDIVDKNLFHGLGISIFVMVLSFGFLVCAAGHRRAVEGIVLTAMDRIPLELFTLFAVVAELVFLFLGMALLYETDQYAYTCIGVFGVFGVMMTVIAVAYILSLCVRVKAGKWWRNSICYRIFSRVCGIVVRIFRNISLLWKGILIIGMVLVAEIFILCNFDDALVLFLFVEKAVLCGASCVLVLQVYELQKAGQCMAEGDLTYKINTEKMFWECRKHGENLNKIGEGMSRAVDERMKSERLKTELITNVSHDIKTPLTSIINYVDLLSKEELHNEKAAEYLEVLDRQSSKLKKLIEDLVEASKASSGNLAVDSQQLEAGVFVTQTVGEFEEKLSIAGLELIVSKPEEPVYIMADGRHIWRVIDNLMNNICKYAQTGSRVYVNLEATEKRVSITFRNISKYPLNISGEELTERFVRGDRSRNTEGHGLGLSIAQSLMKLIGGDMNIVVDGDLFKVVLTFDRDYSSVQEPVAGQEEGESTNLT